MNEAESKVSNKTERIRNSTLSPDSSHIIASHRSIRISNGQRHSQQFKQYKNFEFCLKTL